MSSTSAGVPAAGLQQERDDAVKSSSVRAIFSVERRVERPSLMLNLKRPTREKSYFCGFEEHALEQVARGVEGRRIARAHAAVDLDQRLLRWS